MVVFINSLICFSQNEITFIMQAPNDFNSDFKSVYCIDTNNIVVVGSNGKIFKSYDSGKNWQNIYSGTNQTLGSVFFANDSVGYIAGDGGTILKSVNCGDTWTLTHHESMEQLNNVYFPCQDTGFIVGKNGIILSTFDGGSNWNQQISTSTVTLNEVFFVNPLVGYAVGESSTILKTTDSGVHWTKIIYTASNRNFHSVYFTSAETGYIVGGGSSILKTNDYGENWEIWSSLYASDIHHIQFIDTTYVLACATYSETVAQLSFFAVRRNNEEWNQVCNGPYTSSNTFHFADSLKGFYIDCKKNGFISKTENSGLNWERYSKTTFQELQSICYTDSLKGYAVGKAGNILSTINSGEDWIAQESGTNNNLNSVFFSDSSTGYIVGDTGIILKSFDSGINWTELTSNTNSNLNSVFFTENNTGYAVGNSGVIMRTTDQGNNWAQIACDYSYNLFAVFFVNDSVGYIGGNGIIMKTIDYGLSWVSVLNSVYCYSLYFIDENTGYAIDNSNIIKTTDGGLTWNDSYIGEYSSGTFSSVRFINENFGIASGYYYVQGDNHGNVYKSGNIVYTTNGGATWNRFDCTKFNSVFFTNLKTAYGVAEEGLIYKINFDLNLFIPQVISDSLFLYPNPNNGEFTLELDSDAKVDVIDGAGRLVYSQQYKDGSSLINLGNLAPSTYYVRVISKEKTIVKKIMICK